MVETNTRPTLSFNICILVERCTVHGKCPFKKILFIVFHSPNNRNKRKFCAQKELVLMETYISDFRDQFHITEI